MNVISNEAANKFIKPTNVFKSRALAAMPIRDVVRETMRRAAVVATLILSGCAATGPHRLLVDRFDYSAAIASSTNEQMLLNLVRLRYNETPVFLDVNSVIAQYQADASAQLGVEVGFTGSAGPPGDNLAIPEVGAGWLERPTITYAPRTGPKFIRSLLTPLSPVAIFALVQGNWPVEDVVWGVVKSINGVGPQSPITGQWNPDYQRMLDALSQLQQAKALGVGRSDDSPSNATLRFRDSGTDEKTAKAIATLREIWDLDPGTNEYRMVLRVIPRNHKEIAVLTSSMLDLMRDVASLMEVPPENVSGGQTAPTFKLPSDAPYGGRSPISVQLDRERPGDAFVAVKKDDWWYSIATNDQQSKRVLLILNVLFQLAESGEYPGGPVVTVPAGG